MLPSQPMQSLLLDAYKPCELFRVCGQATWKPETGHVPRGFLGATGALTDVEVVMVFSQPGHPHDEERYDIGEHRRSLMEQSSSYVYGCFETEKDRFHRNVRGFLDMLYPSLGFDQQLHHVWMTNGRLCSIDEEVGPFSDQHCAERYLRKQLEALPNAKIVAFGKKAQVYLSKLNVDFIGAYSFGPPAGNTRKARASWEAAIARIKDGDAG